jgi:pimeloyl-ACP methyl ester carboxylesterase
VLIFDFYGQGLSGICSDEVLEQIEKEYGGKAWRLLVDQLHELLSALHLINDQNQPQKIEKKIVLVGHSLGGLLASDYSRRFPNNVSGLVLFNPVGCPLQPSFLQHFSSALSHSLQRILQFKLIGYLVIHGIGSILRYVAIKFLKVTHSDLEAELLYQYMVDLKSSSICPSCELEKGYLNKRKTDQFSHTNTNNKNMNRKGFFCFVGSFISLVRSSFHKIIHALQHFRRSVGNLSLLDRTWMFQLIENPRRPKVFRMAVEKMEFYGDNREVYRQISSDLPVLLFWGHRDAIFPASHLSSLRHELSHRDESVHELSHDQTNTTHRQPLVVIELAKGDHSSFLQQPFLVARHLLRWLNYFLGPYKNRQRIENQSNHIKTVEQSKVD